MAHTDRTERQMKQAAVKALRESKELDPVEKLRLLCLERGANGMEKRKTLNKICNQLLIFNGTGFCVRSAHPPISAPLSFCDYKLQKIIRKE